MRGTSKEADLPITTAALSLIYKCRQRSCSAATKKCIGAQRIKYKCCFYEKLGVGGGEHLGVEKLLSRYYTPFKVRRLLYSSRCKARSLRETLVSLIRGLQTAPRDLRRSTGKKIHRRISLDLDLQYPRTSHDEGRDGIS